VGVVGVALSSMGYHSLVDEPWRNLRLGEFDVLQRSPPSLDDRVTACLPSWGFHAFMRVLAHRWRGAETRAALSTTGCVNRRSSVNRRQPPRRVRISLRSPLPSLRCFGPAGESLEIPAFGAASREAAEPENATTRRHRRNSPRKSLPTISLVHFAA
jgi:hypothetical protein